ncbi:hydrolase [Lentzea sp. NBRC 105346]|uniref:amidohydrolase family protein n=1 Tax=Lentzea sp. NBRC 105346 TaxID=3032205 RepID=UPI00249FE763|nr:amidohydrolase family protein [Lentzea sp. NBRC 105346]GLZ30780.1 hydrolase [Lentzea sp. NBRC 105346]
MPSRVGTDDEVRPWLDELGLPGLVDIHVHFMPQNVLDKVWSYFDGTGIWPINYRTSEEERLQTLRNLGVTGFAPLVYPHKPGMAAWLNDWALDFGTRVPEAVPTATFFAEPDADEYVRKALDAGARCFKVHVQVGAYDPRDPLLDPVWGMIAEAGVPVVTHAGNGPIPGAHTGMDVLAQVLERHPRLTAVIAHAGMPDYLPALDLVRRFPRVHIDTTMVGVPFSEAFAPLPDDWALRLADLGDRVAFGSDFPNIPYDYATQLRAIAEWEIGSDFLRSVLYFNPSALLRLN